VWRKSSQRLNSQPDFPYRVAAPTVRVGVRDAGGAWHACRTRVGCYTSRILHYNERVRIAKQQVSDAGCALRLKKLNRRQNKHNWIPACRGITSDLPLAGLVEC